MKENGKQLGLQQRHYPHQQNSLHRLPLFQTRHYVLLETGTEYCWPDLLRWIKSGEGVSRFGFDKLIVDEEASNGRLAKVLDGNRRATCT